MQDFFNLPMDTQYQFGQANVQIFNRPSSVTNTEWYTWEKPRGKSMLSIICIGGGGGGGGGFSAAATNTRGGGGSGGSSGMTKILVPLFLLPDTLYIQVGAGGQGVSTGTGGSGVQSFVAIYPDVAAGNLVANSCLNATLVGGGTSGTGAAAGTGGQAGGLPAANQQLLSVLGVATFIAGQAGVNGGAQTGANGTQQTMVNTVITTSGTGGAGTQNADFAGGAWGTSSNWLSEQRPQPVAAGSNDGSGGIMIQKPLFFYGGQGGSSSNTGVGGNGGNGSFGCGGGGGGGGTTGGRGGDGGSGIVILTAW